jgi:hypothetical protein
MFLFLLFTRLASSQQWGDFDAAHTMGVGPLEPFVINSGVAGGFFTIAYTFNGASDLLGPKSPTGPYYSVRSGTLPVGVTLNRSSVL